MIRILIVDDQQLVRTGFRMILDGEEDMTVVAEAGDGRDAVAIAEQAKPDVVLMDIRMPNMDGIEATRRLVDGRGRGAGASGEVAPDGGGAGGEVAPDGGAPRVIILTTFDLDEYVFEALRAGASGFLLKDAPPDDLVEAIRIVAAGEALLSPSVTRQLIREFVRQPPATPRGGAPEELTERELEVLRHVARGRSNAEIAEELYISETTVKTHVSRVLAKLDVRDRVQAVVYAYEHGLAGARD